MFLSPANKVTNAVRKLKKRKDPGPDGLLAEHLKAGGEAVNIWLRNILNAVVELEVISEVLHEEGCYFPCVQSW